MINQLFGLSALLILTASVFGQKHQFRPTIVILYPYEKLTSEEIDKELKVFKAEIEMTEEKKAALLMDVKDGPENWKQIREKEIEFLRKQDFFTYLTLGCEIYLSFKLFEYNPKFLAFPARDSCNGDVRALEAIAAKYKVNWVLNFPKITLEKKGTEKRTTVTFQLYNALAGKVLLQKDYTGINKNPGLEFTCEHNTDSWECTLNNLESVALFDILDIMEENKKYWR